MFQFTRFPCLRMIQVHCIGFPHSDTDIYCGCIRLNVAFRSIPRPSSARDAKTSSMSPYSLCPCDTEKRMVLCVSTCHPDTAANRIPVALYLMSCHIQLLRCCSRRSVGSVLDPGIRLIAQPHLWTHHIFRDQKSLAHSPGLISQLPR
jgi:hypothetical protein